MTEALTEEEIAAERRAAATVESLETPSATEHARTAHVMLPLSPGWRTPFLSLGASRGALVLGRGEIKWGARFEYDADGYIAEHQVFPYVPFTRGMGA